MEKSQKANSQRTALIVEDFPVMRRILRHQLVELGFQDIDTAANGLEALSLLGNRPYDIVISDWNMHPITGEDLVRAVRADQKLAETRFVMITADSRTERMVAARLAGVDAHLLKPFDARTLGEKIRMACAA